MVELQLVTFHFNQNEYTANVVAGGHEMKVAFRLEDNPDIIVFIELTEYTGVKSLKTLTEEQAKSCDEIWEAVVVPEKNKFQSGMPHYVGYQLKLRDGKVVDAELRLQYGKKNWVNPCTGQPYAQTNVVGWRPKGR